MYPCSGEATGSPVSSHAAAPSRPAGPPEWTTVEAAVPHAARNRLESSTAPLHAARHSLPPIPDAWARVTNCVSPGDAGYHPSMDRPWPSPRPSIALATLAAALLALAPGGASAKAVAKDGASTSRKVAAKGTRSAAKGQARKTLKDAPPPDPLAGAWPSREDPQLGDGTLRSELLVAARRLVGLCASFDEDGFVRHLAYVMDVARKRDLPEDAWARSLARRAAARGFLKKDAKARPGDLVIFSLDTARPASVKASRILVGVAESAGKGAVRFVAPLGNKVSRAVARPGRKPNQDDTAIRECRSAEPYRAPVPGKSARKTGKGKGKAKLARAPRTLPCRAGELWIGRIPAESLALLF